MRRILVTAVATLLIAVLAVPALAGSERNFRAHLNGDGAGVETLAQGQAIFQFSQDGSELSYKLIVANLENLWMAHIHVAAEPGGNGPPVVWLLPDAPPPGSAVEGTSNGVVAQGVAIEGDAGVSISFDDLRTAIAEGRAYVNVHTNDFIEPPNTGPGDFPGGEIRGDIH
ncbi:MAG TPA: CHRD domain-containing protein [Acidimicrobiia bacterium]|nr:CHRD domain-containing protein [Acidimicrobiia bacterium]